MAFGFLERKGTQAEVDVSVVLPVYNHERFVTAAIESVLAQSVQPREIICIDDGSSDGSAQAVQDIASRTSRVRCWTRANQGAHRTINEGVRAATSGYVAILNSDDIFHPRRLERCLAVFEADPEIQVVASAIDFIDGDGRRIANPWYEGAYNFHQRVGDLGLALVNGNFLMTTSNIVARRALFDEVGEFDALRYAHDLDFFLRLVVEGKRVSILPQRLLTYRMHASNTIAESHAQVRLEWAVVAAFFAERMVSFGDPRRARPDLFHYLSRLFDVIDGHKLTKMVALSLLRARGADRGQTPGACLADDEFRSALRELAQ